MNFEDQYNNNLSNDNTDSSSKHKPKKRLRIFTGIFIAAVLTILYISNLMYVNKTMQEVYVLNKEYEEVVNKNELLMTKIIELESPERIITFAKNKLGMIKSNEAPKKIN